MRLRLSAQRLPPRSSCLLPSALRDRGPVESAKAVSSSMETAGTPAAALPGTASPDLERCWLRAEEALVSLERPRYPRPVRALRGREPELGSEALIVPGARQETASPDRALLRLDASPQAPLTPSESQPSQGVRVHLVS